MVWLEVVQGTKNKRQLGEARTILDQFELIYLTPGDQAWAMEQLARFQFSHHISKDDCLIASAAFQLQRPLYTHNLKDMTPLIGALALQPYA